MLVDQSSSATAFVKIRRAAEEGSPIPLGWALDKQGNPTNDAKAALEGTLLAFGGARGANVALMVEILAAGVSGANWSLDAPSFVSGNACPRTGLFVLALSTEAIGDDFEDRMDAYLKRLAEEYGVHIPGARKAASRSASETGGIDISEDSLARLRALASPIR